MTTFEMKTTGLTLVLGMALAGCGGAKTPVEEPEEPGRFAVTSVSPSNIKANYDGDIYLYGAGFEQGAEVLVDGVPVTSIPGATMQVVDENTIRVYLAYAGAGQELQAGDYQVQVELGTEQTSPSTLHVRPILAKLEHVRTLPGFFLKNGGFLDLWVQPFDSEDTFIGLGHEIAGAAGLGRANFFWDNVRLTRVADGALPEEPSLSGVANVEFTPVGTANPLAVAITIDQSGSMIGLGSNPVPSDPNDERVTQSQAFVDRMGATDEATVLRFQGQAGAVFTVVPFSSDKQVLKDGLETLRTGETGNTPLYDAMIRSVNEVAAKGVNATKAVIVLTDGRDTTSTATAAQAITAARDAGIPIYSIGLGNPNDPASLDRAQLQEIADQTGGRVFFAEDPAALAGIFDQLTAILKDSYRLEAAVEFDPPLTQAGTYKVEGDVVAEVDGETLSIPMPAFHVSVLN